MKTTDKEILEHIKTFIKQNKYSPSVREIGSMAGLTSPATVHSHLCRLKNTKRIDFEENKSRTIRVLK